MKRFFIKAKSTFGNVFLRGSIVLFAGSMLTNVLAYAYHLSLGRIMGPEQYGELAALLSIFYIINSPSVVIQTILVKFFTVFYAKKQYGKSKQLFIHLVKLSVSVLVVGGLVLLPLSSFVSSFLKLQSPISIVFLYCIFAVFFPFDVWREFFF